ncbi:MAG: hypothetical protein K2X95_00475 [Flavobacteriaceae bacterium]|nr:hypothetical protein [Flavobacteriaceae bacterium]
MKPIKLFITAMLLLTINSYAQLDKKTWLVGGTGSFNSYKQEQTFTWQNTGIESKTTYTNRDLELSAKIGYFIIDKLVLGITPTYTNNKSENKGATITSYSSTFSIGPFARYYFLKKDKPFNILAEANYEFGFLSKDDQPKEKGSVNRFTFLAGPEIFFNSSVGMEVLLGYKMYNPKMDNPNYISYKENGFQLAIGFQIHLEKL